MKPSNTTITYPPLIKEGIPYNYFGWLEAKDNEEEECSKFCLVNAYGVVYLDKEKNWTFSSRDYFNKHYRLIRFLPNTRMEIDFEE